MYSNNLCECNKLCENNKYNRNYRKLFVYFLKCEKYIKVRRNANLKCEKYIPERNNKVEIGLCTVFYF